MAVEAELKVKQHNDETIAVTVTSDIPGFVLTGKVVEFYIKPTRTALDTDSSVTKLFSPSNGVVITGALAATVSIPSEALDLAGDRFYRLDAVEGATRITCAYGLLRVVDL